jgi:omega-amidase
MHLCAARRTRVVASQLLGVWNRRVSMAAAGSKRPLDESASQILKVALCQLEVGPDKSTNIARARKAIEEAADAGAKLVCLPECWNCPYGNKYFAEYSEKVPSAGEPAEASVSPSSAMLVEVAKAKGVYICGGSMPEKEGDKIYNSGVAVDSQGSVLAKYRKVHLFDIDIPGKMTFKESDTLTPGDRPTVFDTPWGKMGAAICYDMRFPELSMLMRAQGAKVILFPGAFNTTTGPKHYELLARGRAIDNQCFVVACSPARLPGFEYQAYGHSTAVDPWGKVLVTCEEKPCIVYADFDMAEVETFRTNVPISKQKRPDIYSFGAAGDLLERTSEG